MKALDNLKADFQSKLGNGESYKVDFPEIGIDCFVRDVITANRRNAILQANQNGLVSMAAEMIIQTLRYEDGSYIFKSADKTKLMRDSDSAVIERVAMEIMPIVLGVNSLDELEPTAEGDPNEIEEAVKNSRATAKSRQDSTSPTS